MATTIKLTTPIELGGVKRDTLELKREPNIGDLRACSIDPATIISIGTIVMTGKGGLSQEQLIKLASRLSGQSEQVIEEISSRDMLEVHDALLDFFSPAEENSAGQVTPSTSDEPSS